MHFMVWKALPIVTCHMDCSRETAQLCTPPPPTQGGIPVPGGRVFIWGEISSVAI